MQKTFADIYVSTIQPFVVKRGTKPKERAAMLLLWASLVNDHCTKHRPLAVGGAASAFSAASQRVAAGDRQSPTRRRMTSATAAGDADCVWLSIRSMPSHDNGGHAQHVDLEPSVDELECFVSFLRFATLRKMIDDVIQNPRLISDKGRTTITCALLHCCARTAHLLSGEDNRCRHARRGFPWFTLYDELESSDEDRDDGAPRPLVEVLKASLELMIAHWDDVTRPLVSSSAAVGDHGSESDLDGADRWWRRVLSFAECVKLICLRVNRFALLPNEWAAIEGVYGYLIVLSLRTLHQSQAALCVEQGGQTGSSGDNHHTGDDDDDRQLHELLFESESMTALYRFVDHQRRLYLVKADGDVYFSNVLWEQSPPVSQSGSHGGSGSTQSHDHAGLDWQPPTPSEIHSPLHTYAAIVTIHSALMRFLLGHGQIVTNLHSERQSFSQGAVAARRLQQRRLRSSSPFYNAASPSRRRWTVSRGRRCGEATSPRPLESSLESVDPQEWSMSLSRSRSRRFVDTTPDDPPSSLRSHAQLLERVRVVSVAEVLLEALEHLMSRGGPPCVAMYIRHFPCITTGSGGSLLSASASFNTSTTHATAGGNPIETRLLAEVSLFAEEVAERCKLVTEECAQRDVLQVAMLFADSRLTFPFLPAGWIADAPFSETKYHARKKVLDALETLCPNRYPINETVIPESMIPDVQRMLEEVDDRSEGILAMVRCGRRETHMRQEVSRIEVHERSVIAKRSLVAMQGRCVREQRGVMLLEQLMRLSMESEALETMERCGGIAMREAAERMNIHMCVNFDATMACVGAQRRVDRQVAREQLLEAEDAARNRISAQEGVAMLLFVEWEEFEVRRGIETESGLLEQVRQAGERLHVVAMVPPSTAQSDIIINENAVSITRRSSTLQQFHVLLQCMQEANHEEVQRRNGIVAMESNQRWVCYRCVAATVAMEDRRQHRIRYGVEVHALSREWMSGSWDDVPSRIESITEFQAAHQKLLAWSHALITSETNRRHALSLEEDAHRMHIYETTCAVRAMHLEFERYIAVRRQLVEVPEAICRALLDEACRRGTIEVEARDEWATMLDRVSDSIDWLRLVEKNYRHMIALMLEGDGADRAKSEWGRRQGILDLEESAREGLAKAYQRQLWHRTQAVAASCGPHHMPMPPRRDVAVVPPMTTPSLNVMMRVVGDQQATPSRNHSPQPTLPPRCRDHALTPSSQTQLSPATAVVSVPALTAKRPYSASSSTGGLSTTSSMTSIPSSQSSLLALCRSSSAYGIVGSFPTELVAASMRASPVPRKPLHPSSAVRLASVEGLSSFVSHVEHFMESGRSTSSEFGSVDVAEYESVVLGDSPLRNRSPVWRSSSATAGFKPRPPHMSAPSTALSLRASDLNGPRDTAIENLRAASRPLSGRRPGPLDTPVNVPHRPWSAKV